MTRVLLRLLACGLIVSVRAADEQGPAPLLTESRRVAVEAGAQGSGLLGNWGALGTKLNEKGVQLRFGYIGEIFGNVSGGRRTGALYTGIGEASLELNLERLSDGRWPGATLYASALWTHGQSLSAKLAGDALGASNIDAYDSVRLYELWLEQTFCNEHLSVRAGNLLADAEFAGTDYGGALLNSAFGWPTFISANVLNTGPAFYAAALGLRLRWTPNETWFVQAGVFDGDSFDSPAGDPRVNASGLHWQLSRTQGAFAIGEINLRLNPGADAAGLPGIFKIGAWLHTADFADNYRDAAGGSFVVSGRPARIHGNNFGAYLAAEQMLWREGDSADEREQGLGLFGRFGAGPRDRSAFEWVACGGARYRGLLPGRDEDTLALGAVFAQVSRDLRRQQRDDRDVNGTPYAALADHEFVVELTYGCQLQPWLVLQPDFQWIHHPGTSSATADAYLLGLRFNVTF